MKRGFTLIELVIVIVILGILAAVAIPKFADLTIQAKVSATRGALGGVRSGISIFYASQAAAGTATWPTLIQLEGTDVMAQGIPPNPYVTDATLTTDVVAGVTKGTTVVGGAGWAYLASSGQFWANSAVAGENNW